MDEKKLRLTIDFYENELKNNILSFWLPRCEDKNNGGYLNCFTNDGAQLVSKDKYTWSQGRFVWLFSKLSRVSRLFSEEQREEFLRLAKNGRDFLVDHCFIKDMSPLRCAFLMDEAGNHKYVDGCDRLDMSIYADGFVLAGLTQYSAVTHDRETYEISKELYESILQRYADGTFASLPYPVSPEYTMHGFAMNRLLHAYHMLECASILDKEYAEKLKADIKKFVDYLFDTFTDSENVLRELVYADGTRVPGIFGNHCNPGHILEDVWFIQHSVDAIGCDFYNQRIANVAKKALELGWDKQYGGILHFCSATGGEPTPGENDPINEPVYKQLMSGWGDKLWWIHSEALYTTLMLGERYDDDKLREWYEKIFEYTFRVFPNPDKEIREWIQIQTREGKPQTKVVALPVKDPFHIARNMLYILLFLYTLEENR